MKRRLFIPCVCGSLAVLAAVSIVTFRAPRQGGGHALPKSDIELRVEPSVGHAVRIDWEEPAQADMQADQEVVPQETTLNSLPPNSREMMAREEEEKIALDEARESNPILFARSENIGRAEAEQLVAAGDAASVDRLLRAIAEISDPQRKMELADAFRGLSSPDGVSLLMHTLAHSRDEAVLTACRHGLANLGPAFVGEVVRVSEKADPEVDARIAEVVSVITNPAYAMPISKMAVNGLAAGRTELAGAAACALANMGTPEAQEQLVSLAAMPGFPEEFADALLRINHVPLAPILAKIASGEMPAVSESVRKAAAQAASRLGWGLEAERSASGEKAVF